jgi:hypothetical protein
MYKDAIHEGFAARRFARSIVVGGLAAIILHVWLRLPVDTASGVLVLFGLAYALERGCVEVWKTFIREESQSKYTIPMQFSVLGRPVISRGRRFAAGAAYLGVVVICLTAIAQWDRVATPPHLAVAAAGFGLGLITALGGLWKDAPIEGLERIKFFRSPLMTAGFAFALSLLTSSALFATVGAIGYERSTAEMYKTFVRSSKPRGKFAGKPVTHPEMLRRRQRFVPVYVAIRLVLVSLVVGAFV